MLLSLKISIINRCRSLVYTKVVPTGERDSKTEGFLANHTRLEDFAISYGVRRTQQAKDIDETRDNMACRNSGDLTSIDGLQNESKNLKEICLTDYVVKCLYLFSLSKTWSRVILWPKLTVWWCLQLNLKFIWRILRTWPESFFAYAPNLRVFSAKMREIQLLIAWCRLNAKTEMTRI